MNPEDQATIEAFVLAEPGTAKDLLREASIKAWHKYLRAVKQGKWDIYMKFMSEIDSPCPDYGLRGMYRQQVMQRALTRLSGSQPSA